MSQPNTAPQPGAGTWSEALAYPLACIGAIAGAVVGFILAKLLWRMGLYALVLVGPTAGMGARLLVRKPNAVVALMAAAIALLAGIWTEWVFWPFKDDDSLAYFLQHLPSVDWIHLLLIAIGAAVAFFIAWRS